MGEFPVNPDREAIEKQKPTPEEIGEAIKTILSEALSQATDEDKHLYLQEQSGHGIAIPSIAEEEREVRVADDLGRLDSAETLEEKISLTSQLCVQELASGRDVFEVIEELGSTTMLLGLDTGQIISRLVELGIFEAE